MRNAIITYAEGNDFVQTLDSEIFLHNLKKHKNFDKIVFTRGLTEKNLNMLSRYFDEVIVCSNAIHNNARDRFMAYYNWMVERLDKYEYVMHLDFRDIVIQKDPFEFMKSHPNKDVFVVSEGMKIKDNYWNNMDMTYYHTHLHIC